MVGISNFINQSKLNKQDCRGCGISANIGMLWRFFISLVEENVSCYFVDEAPQ